VNFDHFRRPGADFGALAEFRRENPNHRNALRRGLKPVN
jgi:hypothetical protein